MRWFLAMAVALLAGCGGSAPTPSTLTSSFSPADAKTLAMICAWRASVVTVSDGLKPLIAQFPVVSDRTAFKASLDGLRGASATLIQDPVSRDPWLVALERRHPRPELMVVSKALDIDSGPLATLFTDLDAWATKDNLDPTSDRAALLQEEIAARQPLQSEQLGVTPCP
jgi:hypothetical protein